MYRLKFWNKKDGYWVFSGLMDKDTALMLMEGFDEGESMLVVDTEYCRCKYCINMANRKCKLDSSKVNMFDSCNCFDPGDGVLQ